MNLREIYSNKSVISFEVFPEENTENLYNTLDVLSKYNPSLISLTYGAGGKNKNFSVDILDYIKNTLEINVMPHFTCICNSREMVESNIKSIEKLGIQNILALRGDIPEDKDVCHFDFKYANELVEFVKSQTNLSVAVAGYPEGHIESADLKSDIYNLKRKIDAGGEVIYTQLFFDNDKFFNFVARVNNFGITTPIVAGIMPILSRRQIDKMTKLANIEVPNVVLDALERYNTDDLKKFGIDYASKQCQSLLEFGVDGLHFYTLNKHYSTSKILDNIL